MALIWWEVLATLALMYSLLPVTLLYGLVAVADAKWRPARPPRFVLPPERAQTRWFRLSYGFLNGVVNLFEPRRTATLAFWLVILVAGLGLAGYELYIRLASGNWPRSLDAHFAEVKSTGLLAVAVFYVVLGLLRLVRLARGSR